jgi:transposase
LCFLEAGVARPSKYTLETVAKIVQAIEQGASFEVAAAYASISYQTFNVWRKQFPEFSESIKGAEAQAEVTWLERIEAAAANGTWQAAAWKLERRYPDRWGRKERLELSTRREAERLAEELGLNADELIRVAEQIATRKS